MSSDQPNITKRVSDALEDFQDGNLDTQQLEELRQLLAENAQARQAFCEHNLLSQLVSSKYLFEGSSQSNKHHRDSWFAGHKRWISLAVAASLLIGIATIAYQWPADQRAGDHLLVQQDSNLQNALTQVAFRPESAEPPVAVLVDATDAKWNSQGLSGASGVPLRQGWLDLASGSASVRFDSGAVATLIGPARFQILDSKQGFLASGSMVANVPESAIGFQVHTKAMQLTDLGTEFGVSVSDSDEAEVYVIKGLVEVESETSENVSTKVEMRENQAKKFASKVAPGDLPMDQTLAEKVVASRPDQRIGYYTFRSIDNGDGTWTTDPSAKTVGGDGVTFRNFHHVGVEPGPIEFKENLNRWSFKSWRQNYRQDDFYVGFKVAAEPGQLIQLNRLSLELFRAGGREFAELAPQDGVVRVSSDGFKTFQRFVLMDNETFVLEPKFVSADFEKIKPAAEFEFRFLFKGQSKARAIRLDEVTLDLDVVEVRE